MRASLTMLVFALTSLASAQPAIDPYTFTGGKALHSAEVNQLWRALGISEKIRETTASGSKDTDESFGCGPDGDCEGQSFPPEWPLLGGGGDDMVVSIHGERDLTRFLVLHQAAPDGPWRLVDYLDSTDSHYAPARASVVDSGGKRWLVVTSHPRCGTGCFVQPADWFELQAGKFRFVLSVPSLGHENVSQLDRYFEARFVRVSQSFGREILEFVYHVNFRSALGSSVDVGELWDEEKVIRFSRANGDGEFKFNAKTSGASRRFIDNIFGTELAMTPPLLFELVQDRLLEMARGPNDRRREWLKDLLENNPNLPQLARVREAFDKPR